MQLTGKLLIGASEGTLKALNPATNQPIGPANSGVHQ